MARITFEYGINETEATQPNEALTGHNFDLELGAKRLFPRKPIDLKGTLPNAGSVNGLMQLVKRDNTETTIVYSGATTTPAIYSWTGANTSTAFTSKRTTNLASSSMLRDTYWSLGDSLVITDIQKLTPILNWGGTTLSRHKTNLFNGTTKSATLTCSSGTVTAAVGSHGYSVGDLVDIAGANEATFNGEYEITTVPSAGAFTYAITSCPTATATGTITSEKGVELFAKYAAVHNGRLWLFNVKTDSDDNPHMCLASTFEDYDSFDTVNRNGVASGNAAFFTLSPDLRPINGVTVFNKQLIISTVDGALHRLSGVDAADYKFTTYYAGSAAIGAESISNIGNDVVFMKKGGNIDRLSDTDRSGDVSADDISRFIPDTTHDLTDSLTVYEQQHQKVYFFIAGKVIVLFKDIMLTGGGSPWTVYKTLLENTDATNVFASVKAARAMRRPGETTETVYFGGTDGKIYDMDGSGTGDNALNIQVSRKSMLLESSRNQVMQGYMQYRRLGEFSCSLLFDWSNEYNTTQCDITLKGPPAVEGNPTYYGGSFYYNEADNYYNEGFTFSEKVSKQNFSPAGRADGFFLTYSSEATVQFQIDFISLLE